jgi:uncharacterized membrane protein YozB (DUF420 family)
MSAAKALFLPGDRTKAPALPWRLAAGDPTNVASRFAACQFRHPQVTMYSVVLFTHSWLRYLVLGFGIALLVLCARDRRTGQWADKHERLHVLFLAILDVQFLLGLLLYFKLSPYSQAALANMGAAMKDPTLRFFGVEHIFTMLIAVVVAHVGRTRSKRKQGGAHFKSVLITQAVWLLLTLAAIPWPGLDVGRPIFRL